MKSLIIKLTVLVLLFPVFLNAQTDRKIDVTPQSIDKIFANWDKADQTGIAVGVVSNGKIIFTKGYGSADLENNIPVTPSTKFLVHDLGNPITIFGIMLLAEKGKLSLQDDIRKHLPDLPDYGQKVTIGDLINHTSGLGNLEGMKTLAGWDDEDLFTEDQAMGLLKNQKQLISKPGEKFEHSVSNLFLLEKVLEKVAGQSLAKFAAENIFQPLGMKNTLFLENAGQVIKQRAKGYNPAAGGGVRNMVWNPSTGNPSELYTTVEDMCLWAMNFRNPKVGSKEIIAKMEAPVLENGQPVKEINWSLYAGQHRFWDFRGTKKLTIIGRGSGYSSKLIRFPDEDLSVVVMANNSPYIGWSASQVAELYLENYMTPPANNRMTNIKAKKLSKATLESYCGDYWDNENFSSRRIYLKNDTLRYSRGGNNESPIVAIGENTFQMITFGKVIVEFEKEGTNKIMNVTVNDGDTFKHYGYQSDAAWTKNLKPFTGTFFCDALNTSYQISESAGQLVLSHPRIGEVTFRPVLENTFAGNRRYFNEIRFAPNHQKGLKGFQFSSFGGDTYWFKKMPVSLAKSTALN